MRHYAVAQRFDFIHALQQEVLELFAFARARRGKLLQCGLQQVEQRGAQFVGGCAGCFEYAIPAQHIGHTQAARIGQGILHLLVPCGKLLQQVAIQRCTALRGTRRVVDAAVHLAALQLRRNRLSQRAFEATQFVRHAQLNVQIAMVDGTQLKCQRAAVELGAGGGIAGHAQNHGKAPNKRLC